MHKPPTSLFVWLGLLFLNATLAQAKTIEVGPNDDWFSKLSGNALEPGDELVLTEGTYSDARRLSIQHRGTAAKPIVIRAAGNSQVTIKRPNAKQNTINIEGSQHLVLRGLEITGGAAAIRISQRGSIQPTDIVIEACHIHHIGGVAITCNHNGGIYQRMIFRRNHIHHTSGHGEALYLGGNNGTAIISESVVQDNYIHHLNGPKVSQGDGIEIKVGSFGNRIIGNVIHDTRYPGVTAYGTASKKRNLIAGNLIWNTADHGIQVAADAIVENNWIANSGGCGIYSREHQGATPGNLTIQDNHIVAIKNPAIRLIGSTANPSSNGPTELIGNQLFALLNHPVARFDNNIPVKARDNSGQGVPTGSQTFADDWKTSKASRTKVPKLKPDHPAAKFITAERLRNALFPEI